jgi:hypothetical protein
MTSLVKEAQMAVCVISENPKGTREVYEKVTEKLAQSGGFPAPGAIFIVAGPADPGWRTISLWDSREAFDRFAAERLGPAWAEMGVSRDDVKFTFFEAHSYMVSEPTGAAQPG